MSGGTLAELFGLSMTTVPELPEGISNRGAALLYAEHGWYVLPLKSDNRPGIDKWDKYSTRDPEQIRSWWPEGSKRGIGLHAGKSGALVIDVDEPAKIPQKWLKVLDEFRGPVQRTRADAPPDDPYSRRAHLIGQMPPGEEFGNGLGSLGSGWCDVRGKNGYIVAAPTEHPKEGGRYQWVRAGSLPLLPEPLYAALRGRNGVRVSVTGQTLELVAADATAAFLDQLPDGKPCAVMAEALADTLETLRAITTGRHGTTLHGIGAMLRLAEQGHPGVRAVLGELQSEFISTVTADESRSHNEAVAEFARMIVRSDGSSGIVSMILEDPTPDDAKGCSCGMTWDGTSTESSDESESESESDTEGESEHVDPLKPRETKIATIAREHFELLAGRERGADLFNQSKSKGRNTLLDIAALLNDAPPAPTIGQLTNGQYLFYRGVYNGIFGATGHGKSWVGIECMAQEMLAGNHVVFFTYELPGRVVTDRLRHLGVPASVLLTNLHLFRDKNTLGQDALEQVLRKNGGTAPTFVLLDSVRELLGARGVNGYQETDISKHVIVGMSDPFTDLDAAFVSIDHVGHENRGRQSGSAAKNAVAQGALYGVNEDLSAKFRDDAPGQIVYELKKDNLSGLPWPEDEVAFYLNVVINDDKSEFSLIDVRGGSIDSKVVELAQQFDAAGVPVDGHTNAVLRKKARAGGVSGASKLLDSAISYRKKRAKSANGEGEQGAAG